MSGRDDIDLEEMRRRLEAQRADLLALSDSTSTDRKPVELDQQSVGRLSRMDAMQVQAMAQSQESRRRTQLKKIDAALKRIAEDEFGYCVACGDDIAAKRLEADPTVVRCVDCAR